jgi:hypothetical protein
VTFNRLRAVLLFLAIGLAAALMPAQADTWWHLRAGHDMWQARALITEDTFSHTVAGVYWPNHEWLFEILVYPLFALGGVALVTLVSAAAATGAWVIVWRETPASPRVKFFLMLGVLVASVGTWSPRPQVFSLLLLMTTVALLRRRRYGWLPLLFVLWANLHGGVLLGVVVLTAAAIAILIEDPRAALRLHLWGSAALLATLLTPMGTRFWIAIVESLGRIRQLGIDEWAPPRITSAAMLPFWIAALLLVAMVVLRGRRLLQDRTGLEDGHLTLCLCAIALLPTALGAVRNVPPFLMTAVPALAALARFPDDGEERESMRVNAVLAAVAAAFVATAIAVSYARGIEHLQWQPLPRQSIAALDRCRGNLYNRYDEGGYLIWFAPSHRVFLDGRQDPYPPALIDDQRRVERSGDYDALFRRYQIACAYLPADSVLASRLAADGWTSLYDGYRFTVLAR